MQNAGEYDVFRDHVVEHYSKEKLPNGMMGELLVWSRPDSGMYRIFYTRMAHWLMVAGDCGEAVYAWSEQNSMDWIGDTDFGYFASKCRASPVGYPFSSWDPDFAKEQMEEYFSGANEGDPSLAEERRAAKDKFDDTDGWSALFSSHEWFSWVQSNGYDVLGPYYSDIVNLRNKGDVRCELHHEGLKRAMAWLKEHKEGPYAEEPGMPVVPEVHESGDENAGTSDPR